MSRLPFILLAQEILFSHVYQVDDWLGCDENVLVQHFDLQVDEIRLEIEPRTKCLQIMQTPTTYIVRVPVTVTDVLLFVDQKSLDFAQDVLLEFLFF